LIANIGVKVEVWDAHHQHLLQTIHAEPRNIAVSPNGHYLALCGDGLNILDATPLLSLVAHPDEVGGKVIVYDLK
jgi:hypothetical protein